MNILQKPNLIILFDSVVKWYKRNDNNLLSFREACATYVWYTELTVDTGPDRVQHWSER